VSDVVEVEDYFGWALAIGDFNGDEFDDLAVGAPFEGIGSYWTSGAVHIFYGSSSGLTATGSEFWYQGAYGLPGTLESDDHFGGALAAGDFDGDGFDDLAVGSEREDIGSFFNAGAVVVIPGAYFGLTPTGSQLWHQDSPGILETAESSDYFGTSLAAGDFNGDGEDDLAIGVPFERVGTVAGAGVTHVLYGSSSLLTATGNQTWNQNVKLVEEVAELADYFGCSLATGDFNGDGRDDLAVGVKGEKIGSVRAGAVQIFYASPWGGGIAVAGNQLLYQGSSGAEGTIDNDEYFGRALATGDVNQDGYADLAVGVPWERVGGVASAGASQLFHGSSSGVSTANDVIVHQGGGYYELAETGDHVGSAVAVGDFDGDGMGDLAAGAPGEDVGSTSNAGAVQVFYQMSGAPNDLWYQGGSGN
jgi:hypothetical protein